MDNITIIVTAVALAPAIIGLAVGGLAGLLTSLFYYAALALCAGAVVLNPMGALAGFLAATGAWAFVLYAIWEG